MSFKKYNRTYNAKPYNKLEYKNYRARTPIKTFRDLDVYKSSTSLCAEIFSLKLPEKYRKNEKIKNELSLLYNLSKNVPRFIAEGHSKKFENIGAGLLKLENAAEITNLIITKIDFLCVVVDDEKFRDPLLDFIKRYQINKRKILNLKKSWVRVYEKYHPKQTQK